MIFYKVSSKRLYGDEEIGLAVERNNFLFTVVLQYGDEIKSNNK